MEQQRLPRQYRQLPQRRLQPGIWWNSLGTPQYGGTMTLQSTKDIVTLTRRLRGFNFNILAGGWERLFVDKLEDSPHLFNFSTHSYFHARLIYISRRPGRQLGVLPTPSTFVVHLRHGINWQNIPPAERAGNLLPMTLLITIAVGYDPKIGYK